MIDRPLERSTHYMCYTTGTCYSLLINKPKLCVGAEDRFILKDTLIEIEG
jgi:hypothetical protein